MTSVLVVRPSSLGDIVHALALVDDVVRFDSEATIDWVAEEAFVELPRLCPRVSRVVPFALRRWKRAPLARSSWSELGAFRRDVSSRRYDAILDLQEQLKGGFVARSARGVRHGFDRASIREPLAALLDDVHHAVPRELHFAMRCRTLAAAALGYALSGPPRWRFDVPASADRAAPDRPYVVALHATSRASKLWPEQRWIELADAFAHAGLAVLLPWGSDTERERSERIARGSRGAIVPPRHSLTTLAALMSRAEIVVGVDTGLTHLAAALGTPTIALFSETDPSRAGVSIAGAHAIDVGGNGRVPALDEVQAAAGRLARRVPAC